VSSKLLLAILGIGAMAVYLLARLYRRDNTLLATTTAAIYVLALAVATGKATWYMSNIPLIQALGQGYAANTSAAAPFVWSSLGLGLLAAVFSGRYLALDRRYEDFYPLLLTLTAGLVGMVMAQDLFTIYLFTALTSITSYLLVGFRRTTDTAIEAAFKYAVLGGLGAMLILAGLGQILQQMGSKGLSAPLLAFTKGVRVGSTLLLTGYGIKAALVPSHTWLPDAHGRAPSSVSALLSGVVVTSFLYIWLTVGIRSGWPQRSLGILCIVAGLLNMTVGNLMALRQVFGKRLLAYSTIAQEGAMLLAFGLGLIDANPSALAAGLFLFVSHAAAKGLAFFCKGVCHFVCGMTRIDELDGLAYQVPWVAAAFGLALASLAGIPPLAGFGPKWLIVQYAAYKDDWLHLLVLIGFLANSLLSLAYYLPLIGRFVRSPHAERKDVSPWMMAPIAALSLSIILLGIWPSSVWSLLEKASLALLSTRGVP